MLQNKIKGCLYGSIVGDIVGSFNEFTFPGGRNYRHINSRVLREQVSVFGFKYGAYTDDTSMSLALMEGLMDADEVPELMQRFALWRNSGKYSSTDRCFDIGGQTSRSISLHEKGIYYAHNEEVEKAAGNGALMRIHPASIMAYVREEDIEKYAHCTHPNIQSNYYCKQFTSLLHLIFDNASKEEVKKEFLKTVDTDYQHGIQSGYVKTSYETAFDTFFETDSFMEGVFDIANEGDDSDTVAAIYGAIAGAYYGFEEIPTWYVDNINKPEYTNKVIQDFIFTVLQHK